MQEFTVDYTFSQVTMLVEPLLLVGFFASLLLAVVVLNRIDFAITHAAPKAKTH